MDNNQIFNQKDKIVNEEKFKAELFDYLMSHILSEDFDNIAAVAGDIANMLFKK